MIQIGVHIGKGVQMVRIAMVAMVVGMACTNVSADEWETWSRSALIGEIMALRSELKACDRRARLLRKDLEKFLAGWCKSHPQDCDDAKQALGEEKEEFRREIRRLFDRLRRQGR